MIVCDFCKKADNSIKNYQIQITQEMSRQSELLEKHDLCIKCFTVFKNAIASHIHEFLNPPKKA